MELEPVVVTEQAVADDVEDDDMLQPVDPGQRRHLPPQFVPAPCA